MRNIVSDLRLEAIAGVPAGVALSGQTRPVMAAPAGTPQTMYVVLADVFAPPYAPIAFTNLWDNGIGVSGGDRTDRARFRIKGVDSYQVFPRHAGVIWAQADPSTGTFSTGRESLLYTNSTLSTGLQPATQIQTSGSGFAHAAIIYNATHDMYTRARIIQWLTARYIPTRLPVWPNLLSFGLSEGIGGAGAANGALVTIADTTRFTSGVSSFKIKQSSSALAAASGLGAGTLNLPIPTEGLRISADLWFPEGTDSGYRIQANVGGSFQTSVPLGTPGQWSRISYMVTGTELRTFYIIGSDNTAPRPTWEFWLDQIIVTTAKAPAEWWQPGS